MMSERFTITKGEQLFKAYEPIEGVDACGKNGQIKGATCCGRTIELRGQDLNRGSAIDFLREQVLVYNLEHAEAPLELPEKGWFFGYCGTSTKNIKTIFNILYPMDLDAIVQAGDAAMEAGDFVEAACRYEQAANIGDDYALCTLAGLYREGKGVDKDINKALDLFSKVITDEQFITFAQYMTGQIYENGEDVEIDIDRALDHYIQSETTHCGDSSGYSFDRIQELLTLDQAYAKAVFYYETNPARTFNFLKFAAEQEHVPSMYSIGCIYANGSEDVEKNTELAIQFFTKAAENGHYNARINLGIILVEEERYDEAQSHFRFVADQGIPKAMFLLGDMAEKIEVYKDETKAREYYKKAADRGNEDAIAALARLNGATD
jgi:TPR repeat protein